MNKLIYQSNEYCWAVYWNGELLTWGKHDSDPYFGLRDIGEKFNFVVENETLPDLQGDAPKQHL